ncbi:MAG: OmpA family protein [bacterium]|nr:MAG: OmpA family protein [bacterium]
MLICLLPAAARAVPAGTVISNAARADFSINSTGVTSSSNTVSVITTVVRSPSALEFLRYAPLGPAYLETVALSDYRDSSGTFQPLAAPVDGAGGSTIDLTVPVPLSPTGAYHQGDPIFLRLTDVDQNLESTLVETVQVSLSNGVSGETELIRLYETSPDSGVFLGYIQSGPPPVASYSGRLDVTVDSRVSGTYTDVTDGTDISAAAALVDPLGTVFDSLTGLPVDGAAVTLVEVDGAGNDIGPATVLGDDGVSSFPATVTTGGAVADSGGTVYNFAPGGFRFPLVSPGSYRLGVVPPAGYSFPSAVSYPTLQASWGGVFAVVDPGTKGEIFVVNPGPIVNIDLAVDQGGTGLLAAKEVDRPSAAVGDFLLYAVTVSNASGTVAAALTIDDRLPAGFRYQKGSTRVDGLPAPSDPAVTADGRSLTFSPGDLVPGGSVRIQYVAEVAAGARQGRAVNTAQAVGGGLASNVARATVRVTEDLFRSRNTVMGRVLAGEGCDESRPGEGIEGVRIYLEDGTYVLTDRRGRYHFEGVRPGTHVLQIDMDTVAENYELALCGGDTRSAGNGMSRFVDLAGGTLWREDFRLALKKNVTGKAALELRSTVQNGGLQYLVLLDRQDVPIRNLRLTVQLPDGVKYRTGSSTLDGLPVADPSVTDGFLTWHLDDAFLDRTGNLQFETHAVEDWSWADSHAAPFASDRVKYSPQRVVRGEMTEVVSRALMTFDTPGQKGQRTPVLESALMRVTEEDIIRAPKYVLHPRFDTFSAALTDVDRAQLDALAREINRDEVVLIYIEGHSDNLPIADRSRTIFSDNYDLSLMRAKSVGRYLAGIMDLPPYMFAFSGRGPDVPIASNDTEAGRAVNRRVEVRVVSQTIMRRTTLTPFQDRQRTEVVTVGLRPGEDLQSEGTRGEDRKAINPLRDLAWLETSDSNLEWIHPDDDYAPAIPAIHLAVKHHPGSSIRLLINGEEVSPLNFEGTEVNRLKTAALSLWRGVNIREGGNRLAAVALDAAGQETGRVERVIHYSSPPVKAELIPEMSKLIADGRAPPVFAVRLTDREGHPARRGIIGQFKVDPPHVSLEDRDDTLSGNSGGYSRFTVGDDGIALLKLAPTVRTGEARLRVVLGGGDREIAAWLNPAGRDWILVGLAEGTVGYNTVSGHMEGLEDADIEEDLYGDGRVALFAKGRIKGEWLLTLAYDSSRDDGDVGNSLAQTIDPDTYYTLYGDDAEQDYEAASAGKLYLKIEGRQFYALFGDYDTGLTVTDLSRYSRSLTGLKAERKTDTFSFNLFAADTDQAFIKDEIRGDGTSGLYRLSHGDLVINSDKVTIETRDRFRSEVILVSREMTRHIDYDIDYQAGTLFFKEPVNSRDSGFNPVFIVVDYETSSASGSDLTLGGRGSVSIPETGIEVGASVIHEGQGARDGDLVGLDITAAVGRGTEIRAEAARTDRESPATGEKGSAYVVEVTHASDTVKGAVYLRRQEAEFGLGQQNGSETGTRKFGLEAVYRINSNWSVSGQGYRQDNLTTDDRRDVTEVEIGYAGGRYDLTAGVRQAEDRFADGTANRSDQIAFGARWRSPDQRLSLNVDHDQSLGDNDNTDFPTRTSLGADYRFSESMSLFASQEFTRGEAGDTSGTRLGMKSNPWRGGEATTSAGREFDENGSRLFANLGLNQTWRMDNGWSFGAGFEHSSTFDNTARRVNENVPPASGGEDFTAVSLGAGYDRITWSWNARVEARDSDTGDKWGVITDLFGEPAEGVGLSAEATYHRTRFESGGGSTDGGLGLGLAYRPPHSAWIILDKLEYIIEEEWGTGADIDGWKVVNNLNANVHTSPDNQLALQYAVKFNAERIDGLEYDGVTDLLGIEDRYSMGSRWDIGAQMAVLHSYNSGTFDYSAGLSLGYTPFTNAWMSFGYNFVGFEDDDFSDAGYRASGPYIKLRLKVDQNSLRALLKQ